MSAQVLPSQHGHTLCTFHRASAAQVCIKAYEPVVYMLCLSHVMFQYRDAVDGALKARRHWESMALADRIAIALKAADIISGPRRAQLCAATMLGQGKNMWQAEIDAGTEMPDFLRFGSKYAAAVHAQQPADHSAGVLNKLEYRGLEGFVAAISPFNFLAIGCNLVSAPFIFSIVDIAKSSSRILKFIVSHGLLP